MSTEDLSIIIVTYNSQDCISECIEHIEASKIPPSTRKIVVDNDSGDNTSKIIRDQFSKWEIIESTRNLGYGGGCNLGIEKTDSKYILILNPDVCVDKNTIVSLIDTMENRAQIGIVGPKLVYNDGSLQRSFRRYPKISYLVTRAWEIFNNKKGRVYSNQYLMYDVDPSRTQNVDWLIGSLLMIRRSALEQVGLFDEKYFMYCEDVDLCWRMNKKGWRITYCPETQARHAHRQESHDKLVSKAVWRHVKSLLRFLFQKWKS